MDIKFLQPQINTIGLVGHWKLWEGTAFDYSLNGNDGTITGAIATYPGFDFEAGDTSNKIACGTDSSLDVVTAPCSFSVWIKRESTGSFQVIFSKNEGAKGYSLRLNDTNKIAFINHGVKAYIFTQTITDTKWHYIAVVLDSSWDATLYYDGISPEAAITHNAAGVSTSAAFEIGKDISGNNKWFDGKIDDLMVFNIAKSAAEIRSIYETTRRRYQV